MAEKGVRVPRFTFPGYLVRYVDEIEKSPPGHRFLLYFQGASYVARVRGSDNREMNRKRKNLETKLENCQWQQVYHEHQPDVWNPLEDSKKYALNSVARPFSKPTTKMAVAIRQRQQRLAEGSKGPKSKIFQFRARITAPIAIGLGNPHSVENGFSFLSPYGLPYIPGSGIKGVVRRAAEELALFDGESGWTIPLVWLLFGFDANSAYIAPPKDEIADEIHKRHKKWLSVFEEYAKNEAVKDELLKWWLSLEAIRKALPEKLRGLANDPVRFCQTLQERNNNAKALRKAIHLQGLLRFWDVFPKIDRMEVDILNPHHKDYFEGKANPVEVEAPKPVFFITIPADSVCSIYCELQRKIDNVPLPAELDSLLSEALSHALEWIGVGAKTAVGYGVGSIDVEKQEKPLVSSQGQKNVNRLFHQKKAEAEKRRREEEHREKREFEKEKEKEEALRIEKETEYAQSQLESFRDRINKCRNLPGDVEIFIQSVQYQEDPDLRKKMCQVLLEKAKALKGKNKFSKAVKSERSWAIKLKKLLLDNGIEVD